MGICSACIYNKKMACPAGCVFANYFPGHENVVTFAKLDQVFHTENLERMILETATENVEELLRCLCYEATERLNNPVTGCVGVIERLQGQESSLQGQESSLQAQEPSLQAQEPSFQAQVASLQTKVVELDREIKQLKEGIVKDEEE